MHGLIFASFRDYLLTEHGAEIARDVTVGEPQYTLSEAYADEQFLALLERACARTALSRDELLFEFGAFTAATTFARLYSVLFKLSPTARDFLLTVETPIHEVIRETLPDARPPELAVTDLGEQGLGIVYTSPRRICAMLRGLVEGTGRVYGRGASGSGAGVHAPGSVGVPVRGPVPVTDDALGLPCARLSTRGSTGVCTQ